MRLAPAVALVLAPALAACVAPAPPPPPPGPQCGAGSLTGLIGQRESALGALRLAGPVRVIRPGQPVTMDYNGERLNIELDRRGRITRIYCG